VVKYAFKGTEHCKKWLDKKIKEEEEEV